jgi:hypothetical protein
MFVLAHIKSRTRRCAGSLKGFSGFAFSRRICAIAITCRIRAGHRVSAIPINAIRVRLCFVIMILHSYTIHIRDPRSRFSTIHIRDSPILAFSRSHPRTPQSPFRSRFATRFTFAIRAFASFRTGCHVAVRTEIRSRTRTPSPTPSHHDRSDTKRSDFDSYYW